MMNRVLKQHISNIFRFSKEFFFPGFCHLCQVECKERLCKDCDEWLPYQQAPTCKACDLPLLLPAPLCPECQQKPPSFDKALTAFVYDFPIDKLIEQYKNQQRTQWLQLFTPALVKRVSTHYGENLPDLVTSVPLHWTKYLRRGFNQSALLAIELANQLDLPYSACLSKHKPSIAQRNLKRNQRRHNMKNMFSCKGNVSGKHIALVDDVITTGATAQTLARLLKHAGAKQVDIWAIARTPKSTQA